MHIDTVGFFCEGGELGSLSKIIYFYNCKFMDVLRELEERTEFAMSCRNQNIFMIRPNFAIFNLL